MISLNSLRAFSWSQISIMSVSGSYFTYKTAFSRSGASSRSFSRLLVCLIKTLKLLSIGSLKTFLSTKCSLLRVYLDARWPYPEYLRKRLHLNRQKNKMSDTSIRCLLTLDYKFCTRGIFFCYKGFSICIYHCLFKFLEKIILFAKFANFVRLF